jgi:hypothetical protein
MLLSRETARLKANQDSRDLHPEQPTTALTLHLQTLLLSCLYYITHTLITIMEVEEGTVNLVSAERKERIKGRGNGTHHRCAA